jgi:heptosyltransferase-2
VIALGGRLDRDGLPGLDAAAHALNRERFDAVIDLQGNARSRWLALRMHTRRRVRTDQEPWARIRLLHAKRFSRPMLPTVDRFNGTLAKIPADVRTRIPEIRISTAARRWAAFEARRTLRRSTVTTVGVHPGARWPTKRWPDTLFADCLSRVAERERARVFLFGSKPERTLMERVAALMPHVPAVIYCGLPLQRVGALVEHCDVFLANDSGLMHLAAGLAVPTVSIFGPTHPSLGFSPQGPRNRIYFGFAQCSPCSQHGQRPCHKKRRYCLERIEPVKVSETISELLSEGKVVGEHLETLP